jgi:hypothetical protein
MQTVEKLTNLIPNKPSITQPNTKHPVEARPTTEQPTTEQQKTFPEFVKYDLGVTLPVFAFFIFSIAFACGIFTYLTLGILKILLKT